MRPCNTCKNWQQCGDLVGFVNCGTCRNQPPKACEPVLPIDRSAEPLFPVAAPNSECSIWAPDHRLFRGNSVSFFPSPPLGRDTDMEANNTTQWTAVTATLSKQTADPHSGVRNFRVAYSIDASGYAEQNAAYYHPFKSSTFEIAGYMRGDGTAVPKVKVISPEGPDDIVDITGTTSALWQPFSARYAWPNCADVLDHDMIYFLLQLGSATLDTGLYVEFDDITIRQTVYKKPAIACWGCKHFQPLYVQGALTRMGECRVQPPLQPIPGPMVAGSEPIFAGLIDASAFWCNAWQRSAKPIPTLPDLPVDWYYDDESPPPIYTPPRPI